LASLNGMAKRRQTASTGLYNELIAQAKFAQDPNKIVFVPAMGIGPIDMVVLDITTGEYQAYDVKTANYRKSDYTPKDKYVRKAGSLINRELDRTTKKIKG
jgi:Tol biopolymer transport system component